MTEAQKTLYYIAENMKMDKSISEEGYEHFQMAIKALEQEPILDKVRAEINAMCGDIETIADVLAIIDKYRAETEGEACKGCHYNDGEVHAECVLCDKAGNEERNEM